jgi:hypothetical protein
VKRGAVIYGVLLAIMMASGIPLIFGLVYRSNILWWWVDRYYADVDAPDNWALAIQDLWLIYLSFAIISVSSILYIAVYSVARNRGLTSH